MIGTCIASAGRSAAEGFRNRQHLMHVLCGMCCRMAAIMHLFPTSWGIIAIYSLAGTGIQGCMLGLVLLSV